MTTTPTLVTADDLDRARALGAAAYARPGASAAPALDAYLTAMLAGLPVGGGGADLMRAWQDGWSRAADDAARAALTDREPPCPHGHGPMTRRDPGTPEQAWCGTWWTCTPGPVGASCASAALVPTAALAAQVTP